MMRPAECAHCGEKGKYNGFSMKYKKVKVPRGPGGIDGAVDQRMWVEEKRPPERSGWSHHDGMKRDHTFHPHDNRSPESDMDRQREGNMMARLEVDHHLQKGFDQLHAENLVNDLFKDRRE